MAARRWSSFGEWVRKQWKAVGGGSDKELAAALHGALEEAGIRLSYGTVPGKLSKLLSGDPEGRQLIQTPAHVQALAATLRVEVPALEAAMAESNERRTLVLDPRLADEIREYFRARADEPGASFAVAEIELGGGAPELKACAEKLSGRPLVVLASQTEVAKFELTGIDVTLTTRGKRAFLLAAPYAELVPEPPQPPPPTFDDEGNAVFSFATDAAIVRDIRRARRMWTVDWVSVPLREAYGLIAQEKRLTNYGGPIVPLEPAPDSKEAARWLFGGGEQVPARAWSVGAGAEQRFLGYGPGVERFADLFAPQHSRAGVTLLAKPEGFEERLARRNPFRAKGSEWWGALREAFLIETMVDLDPLLDLYLAARAEVPTEGTVRLFEEGAEEVRSQIRAIARRPFEHRTSATLPLQLDALANASLVSLPRSPLDALRVLGDLGAGQLIDLCVQRFVDEPASEVVRFEAGGMDRGYVHRPHVIDGGDFRAWIRYQHDTTLEGTARPARERRRRNEEAAAAAAACDDDDD